MGTVGVNWLSTLSEESVGIVGTKGSVIVDSTGKIRKKIEGKGEVIISNYGKISTDSSGNSIANYVSVKNYFIILDEGLKWKNIRLGGKGEE